MQMMVCMRPRLIFSAVLFDVEMDERYFTVPKVVVECVKFIEQYENVTERYLYTDLVIKNYDKQRKLLKYQVNPRSNLKVTTNELQFIIFCFLFAKIKYHKYDAIKSSEAHTVANLLTQFFKKLKTDLIPIDVMEYLLMEMGKSHSRFVSTILHIHSAAFSSSNKENESPNLDVLREELFMLDPMRRDTLRFLLRHLFL